MARTSGGCDWLQATMKPHVGMIASTAPAATFHKPTGQMGKYATPALGHAAAATCLLPQCLTKCEVALTMYPSSVQLAKGYPMKLCAIAAAASVCILLAAPAPASAALYIFEQTGESTRPDPSMPPPTFTASIEVNGTLADLPTLTSENLDPFDPNPPPIDFGNLVALSISTTAGPFDTTLADFGYPFSFSFSFPDWRISPDELYINLSSYEFWIEGFGDDSIIGHRSDGFTCYLTNSPCIAPGRWVEASTVPEPLTIWTFAAGLVGLFGLAKYSRRRRSIPGELA